MSAPAFDPFSLAAREDPYPAYKRLRDEAPLYHNAERGFWAVSRYADVVAISRDWETYTTRFGVDIDNAGDVLGGGFFLTKDPPEHTSLRNVVKSAFGAKTVREALEEPINREVDALYARLAKKGDIDLAVDLAWPLPARVMSLFLGFPIEDCERLTELGIRFLQRRAGETLPPPESNDAGIALMQYFMDIVAERRARPCGDLLSMIAGSEVDGRPIADSAEGMALMIFVGGFENVGCSITNTLYWLARCPDQRAWLKDHPEAIPQAVEEALRYDAPQQNFKRTTTREVELHGVRIPADKPVFLLYGAANRDEREFERPDELDIRCERGRHTSFGEGIHFCIGAPLARLEAKIAVERMFRHVPDYRLTGTPVRLPSHAVRGFARLPAVAR